MGHCFLKVPGRQKAQKSYTPCFSVTTPTGFPLSFRFRGVGRMDSQGNKMAQPQRGVLLRPMI